MFSEAVASVGLEFYNVASGLQPFIKDPPLSFIGVFVGLAISIILIIKKLNPVSSMFVGAIAGTLLGAAIGGSHPGYILHYMISGTIIWGGQSVIGIIVRIVAGGILAGVLIESGAAESIARGIVSKLGPRNSLLAITLSSMTIVAVGVFLPVAVIVLAPITLSVSSKANISKMAAILALSGGAKAGNIISPNPNTIALADTFNLPLGEVMIGGAIPGLLAFVATVILASLIRNKGAKVESSDLEAFCDPCESLPPFSKAIAAPVVTIALLVFSTIVNIFQIEALSAFELDAFLVLPIGGLAGCIIMGKADKIIDYSNKGIMRMAPVVLMLLGAGALSGLILNSDFPDLIKAAMVRLDLPDFLLAPISGAIFGSATGSVATGVIVSGQAFADMLGAASVPAISAAVMIHAGAAFIDVVPHGNYFLASKDSMKVSMIDRIKVMPYEAIVGGVMTLAAIIMYEVIL